MFKSVLLCSRQSIVLIQMQLFIHWPAKFTAFFPQNPQILSFEVENNFAKVSPHIVYMLVCAAFPKWNPILKTGFYFQLSIHHSLESRIPPSCLCHVVGAVLSRPLWPAFRPCFCLRVTRDDTHTNTSNTHPRPVLIDMCRGTVGRRARLSAGRLTTATSLFPEADM